MDAQALLEQLLQSGRKLAEQGMAQASDLAARGKDLASQGLQYSKQKLQIPESGPERDQALKQLGVGAAAGGLLALLLGTEGGRKTLAPIAKAGSLAALGYLGYKAYSAWQQENGQAVAEPNSDISSAAQNDRALMIVRTMIAAARADGNIDERERVAIENRIRSSDLESSVSGVLLKEIQKPLDVAEVAALAKSPIDQVECYVASLMVIDTATPAEKEYLQNLARAWQLDPSLVDRLEKDVVGAYS